MSNAMPKGVSKVKRKRSYIGAKSEVHVRFPAQFDDFFATTCRQYESELVDARARLAKLELPEELRAHYHFAVLEHDQPSFMLLPLMYLNLADRMGGVTEKHRAYLPWFMLSSEIVAVLDDAIDRAAKRSDHQTFADRYGLVELLPFSHFMLATVIAQIADTIPEAVGPMARSFVDLCGLETIEVATRYAKPDPIYFERLLRVHHEQARGAVAHAHDVALMFHGRVDFPHSLSILMGDLMQDVDDLVNFMEERDLVGENDDLSLGTVTYLLLSTLRADPGFAATLDAMWAPYREAAATSRAALNPALRRCDLESEDARAAVRRAVAIHGVPATLEKIHADAERCISSAPPEFRGYAEDVCGAFLHRLRRTPRLREVESAPKTGTDR
ncbi:MAG: hypothetical protein HOW73_42870 [Polyangiaceae bacterium]|nr:hypothetical protein [Polyangiaceae bacterium]